jgi:superfamily II DNA or RNA helicase
MPATINRPPDLGQIVEVRQRRFVVTEVLQSALSSDPTRESLAQPQHLVTLNCIDDDAFGEEAQLLWEIEVGARVHERIALPSPQGGYDDPRRLDAFLDAVRWGAASQADVRTLNAPFRSGIEIQDYQLEPLVRAIQMPRVNLLIADDVGLGKTIEAGLVCQELILRHRVRRALIVCPSSIQIQWRDQMQEKFGLEFRIVDADLMRELRRERGLRVNPWTHFPRLITSIDFLKRETPLRLFQDTLPATGQPTYPRRYDLLIVDEAHNVAPSGAGRYATDSLRTQAIRILAPHFEHKLFVTATPHNGYPESFTALLELLDNQRFARGIRPAPEQLAAVTVRRLKSDLKRAWDGAPQFAERRLIPLEVDYTEAERRAHGLLQEYSRLRLSQADDDDAERCASEFVLKLLKKRMLSSPAAFATTLVQHERTLTGDSAGQPASRAKPTLNVLRRQLDQSEEEFGDDDQYDAATDDTLAAAARIFRLPTAEEQRLLRELGRWADRAQHVPDSKAHKLIGWLDETLKPNGVWNDRRVIIFSEYRATQKWLHQLLAQHGFDDGPQEDRRLLLLYGGMQSDQRERIKAAFQASPSISRARILLATDAASEGIDLQNHCARLIHYEIPWNPNRMEQRNGRVDRHGQREREVLIYHFVGAGYEERLRQAEGRPAHTLEADLEFLMRAAAKVDAIREDLGNVGPVIAAQVEEAMLGRRTRLNTEAGERKSEPVRRMLRLQRRLNEQIEAFTEQLEETRRTMRFTPENLRSIVAVGLELAGQPPLREATVEGIWPDPSGKRATCPVFVMPQLGGSWVACLHGLHHPYTGEPRPITFDHTVAARRDDIVLVHLNHRLVQMCLRLLRAEVWAPEEQRGLHRVTARVVSDSALSTPVVIAHGRLVVVGADGHRLHEEIITAGGAIKEGRFQRMGVGETQAALQAGLAKEAPHEIRERLARLWLDHEKPLYSALETRARERADGLGKTLQERAAKEIDNITTVLTELQATIEAELNAPELVQLALELFADPEREQFELNMDSLRARVAQIPREIERETSAIRNRFAEPAPRLFPVAITYLVPERIAQQAMGGR